MLREGWGEWLLGRGFTGRWLSDCPCSCLGVSKGVMEETAASHLCQIVNGPLALTAITSSAKVEVAGGAWLKMLANFLLITCSSAHLPTMVVLQPRLDANYPFKTLTKIDLF